MEEYNKKVVIIYNKFFYDFVKEVKRIAPDLKPKIKTHYKVKNNITIENIASIMKTLDDDCLKQVIDTISEGNDIFEIEAIANLEVLKEISVKNILDSMKADVVDDNEEDKVVEDSNILKSFVLIFIMIAIIGKCEKSDDIDPLLNTCLRVLRDIQNDVSFDESMEELFDDDIKVVLFAINKVIIKKKASSGSDGATENKNGDGGGIGGDFPNFIENTKIGEIAKEISQDIDLSSMNLERPEDLLNFKENGILNNIVGKVGAKMQEKFESGEITHEQLLSEAMGMIGGMGGMSGMMNNPMFKEMMKGMGGMGGKGAKPQVNKAKVAAMSTRDRLRRKHEKKHGTSQSKSDEM